MELGANGKSGCREGERDEKSEKLATLHSRHRDISSAHSALTRLAGYVSHKAENKCTDESAEFILRLEYTLRGNREMQLDSNMAF